MLFRLASYFCDETSARCSGEHSFLLRSAKPRFQVAGRIKKAIKHNLSKVQAISHARH